MTDSRWPDVVDAFLAATRARPGWRGPDGDGTEADIVVIDAHEPTDYIGPQYLVVGWPGDDGTDDSGTITQAPGPLGPNRWRDEEGTVSLLIVAQGGDDAADEPRTRARAVLAGAVETCREHPDLGLPAVGSMIPQTWVTAGNVRQFLTTEGATCLWQATLTYRARV